MLQSATRPMFETLEDRCLPATLSLGLGSLIAQLDVSPGLNLGSLVRDQAAPRNDANPVRTQSVSLHADSIRVVVIQIFVTPTSLRIEASSDIAGSAIGPVRNATLGSSVARADLAVPPDVPRLTPGMVLQSVREFEQLAAQIPLQGTGVATVLPSVINNQPGGESTVFPVSVVNPEAPSNGPAGLLIPLSPRGSAIETPVDPGGVVIPLPGGATTPAVQQDEEPSEESIERPAMTTEVGSKRLWAWFVLGIGALAVFGDLARRYLRRPEKTTVSLRSEDVRE